MSGGACWLPLPCLLLVKRLARHSLHDDAPPLEQVAADIAKAFGLESNKIVHVKDRAFNDRRYYIGSDKLAALGWKESVAWDDGLKRTIGWYLSTNCEDYWQGDLEAALRPHPLMLGTSLTTDPALAV